VRTVLVTAAVLGLCAIAPAAPKSLPTRTTTETIPADLEFPRPLLGEDLSFDPAVTLAERYAGPKALDPGVSAPSPSAGVLMLFGFVFLGLAMALRRLLSLARNLKKQRSRGRRVRREIRMMA
jgi:hypothetical protein